MAKKRTTNKTANTSSGNDVAATHNDADASSSPSPSPSPSGKMMDMMLQIISDVDEAAAAQRVRALRGKHPTATRDELVAMVIKQRCIQTGAIGAVTSGASSIPGLGTFASLTFGVAMDIGMTFKVQAELVLEIALLYERTLDPIEKRTIVLLVTGLGIGSSSMLNKAGQHIAEKATAQLTQKSIAKAIPVLGVAASAGANVITTYIIGQRAVAYCSLGADAMGDWGESVRAVTGLDERKLIALLTNSAENAWQVASTSVQGAAGAVVGAGKSAGEIIVQQVHYVGNKISDVGVSVSHGIHATGTTLHNGVTHTLSTIKHKTMPAKKVLSETDTTDTTDTTDETHVE